MLQTTLSVKGAFTSSDTLDGYVAEHFSIRKTKAFKSIPAHSNLRDWKNHTFKMKLGSAFLEELRLCVSLRGEVMPPDISRLDEDTTPVEVR